jgi:hypothetical protein
VDEVSNRLRNTIDRRKLNDYQHKKQKNKVRLTKVISRKTTTSFIGAIAQVEKHLGVLWGHGKQDNKCSKDELAWRDIWERCRTEILNNGNKQVRAIERELDDHEIVWNNTRILPVKGNVDDYCK